MIRRRVYLSARALICLCLLVTTGVIGVVNSAWLAVFGAFGAIFIIALLSDRFSFSPAESFSARLKTPIYLELGNTCELSVQGGVNFGASPTHTQIVVTEQIKVSNVLQTAERVAGTFRSNIVITAVRLGFARITAVTAWVPSRLGLWLLSQDIPVRDANFRVLPKRKDLPPEQFREVIMRQLANLQGDRRVTKSASPDLYHSSRPYRYPDPLRFLDRKKTAKFGQLYTKSFDSLQEHHLVLALDLGRAMCGNISGSAKSDHYLSAALGLAEHSIKMHDTVSIVAFSDVLHCVKSRCRTNDALVDLYRGAELVQPRQVTSDYRLMVQTIQRIAAKRAIVVVLTDSVLSSVQSQLLMTARELTRKHLVVSLTMLEDRYDMTSQLALTDSQSLTEAQHLALLYCYSLHDQLRLFGNRIARLGACSVTVPQEYWLNSAVKVFATLRYSLSV